ncbi:PAS fold protein [Roseivivax jejudonensis]|uniref:PAS fold protein n=1 Tax=Roseivivax jejudonensis TaxID=1529041 RepID=A0A1X6Z838_9RHOB|nr:PAS domain-containing protein [Roseivivax jejudonensis]SLN43783.1 PAS fold protein [Roseivivax jejudonensis]
MLELTRIAHGDIEDARAHGIDIDPRTAILMALSRDCIKLVGLDGSLHYMSRNGRCAMEIADPGPIFGRLWWTLWPEEARPRLRDAVELAASGRDVSFVAECPTARGTPACWNVTVTGVRATPDAPVSELLVVSTLTEEPPSELTVA